MLQRYEILWNFDGYSSKMIIFAPNIIINTE